MAIDTLGDALPREIERVMEIIILYSKFKDKDGERVVNLMQNDIKTAHKAMMENDLPAMIVIYEKLKKWEI